MQDFNALINKRMSEKGMTPYRLAEVLSAGISHQTVYNIFRGKSVNATTLAAVFEALDLEVVTKPGVPTPAHSPIVTEEKLTKIVTAMKARASKKRGTK